MQFFLIKSKQEPLFRNSKNCVLGFVFYKNKFFLLNENII